MPVYNDFWRDKKVYFNYSGGSAVCSGGNTAALYLCINAARVSPRGVPFININIIIYKDKTKQKKNCENQVYKLHCYLDYSVQIGTHPYLSLAPVSVTCNPDC